MRGRRPQPTRLKVLRGNPGQRRLNTREPKIQPGVPNPPDWLGDEAFEKWNEVAAGLAGNGNEVSILFKPDDLDTYLKILDSEETYKAMAFDGVKRETVKIAVLDKEFKI